MSDVYGFDAFSPQQIAERVQNVGVTKARLPLMLKASGAALPPGAEAITLYAMLRNLGPVILGNIVGGSVLVALVYHVIYRRPAKPDP